MSGLPGGVCWSGELGVPVPALAAALVFGIDVPPRNGIRPMRYIDRKPTMKTNSQSKVLSHEPACGRAVSDVSGAGSS